MLVDRMSPDLGPGVTFAGFEIESLLGRGAMAVVYRARATDGDDVALKVFDAIGSSDERFRARFLRESELARGLDHPRIVRTISSGESDGRLFLALQLISGTDLRTILKSGRLEPERAVELVGQIADALDAAHAAGVVHRDVKPGNILIDDEGAAYVCDFGLARHVASVSSLTGDRGFVGTIDYVPPEQIEGSPVDARADVYSLGCVLYECLTGVRPFERDSELAVVFAHLNEPPPRPTDVNPDLPTPFDDVIATALAKRPHDRFRTCGELAAAARAALRGKAYARPRPRRQYAFAASVLSLAAGAAVAAVLLTRGGEAHRPITITPTEIDGARLGDSTELLQRMWGSGEQLSEQFPPNYSVLTERTRYLSAYFQGVNDKAVEITTWDAHDRTAEGIGPCSTVARLKQVYGTRLKPNPSSVHDGVASAWTVGEHLSFVSGAPRAPSIVNSVSLFSDSPEYINFTASNEAPCGAAAVATAVVRPASFTKPKSGLVDVSSTHFVPRITAHVPKGWKVQSDTTRELRLVSPTGMSMDFALDPYAVSNGKRDEDVSASPLGLTSGLRHNPLVHSSTPVTVLLGHPALSTTILDLDAPTTGVSFFGFAHGGSSFPVRLAKGKTLRLYLTAVRVGTVVHTLAIAVSTPRGGSSVKARELSRSIILGMTVDAVPVQPLSALGTYCQPVFFGTCKGELGPGRHSSETLRPKLTFSVPPGWTNSTDHTWVFGLVPPGSDWEPDAINNDLSDVIFIATGISPPKSHCHATTPSDIRSPTAYIAWIDRNAGFEIANQRRVALGGLSGYVVDLKTKTGSAAICTDPPPPHYVPFAAREPGGFYQAVSTHDAVRLYLLGYHGGTLGIMESRVGPGPSLDQLDSVVKTFRFGQS